MTGIIFINEGFCIDCCDRVSHKINLNYVFIAVEISHKIFSLKAHIASLSSQDTILLLHSLK